MKTMMLYVTAKDAQQAATIGEALVAEKLVACVNIFDSIRSIYRWKGNVERDSEAVFVAKTTDILVNKTIARIKELHSYEVPCIVALPIEAGNPDFLSWIINETSA